MEYKWIGTSSLWIFLELTLFKTKGSSSSREWVKCQRWAEELISTTEHSKINNQK